MRRFAKGLWALAILGALASCSNAIQDEEQRYEIVKKDGTAAEICAQGDKVAAAYLAAKDSDGYQRARVTANIQCAAARYKESDMRPENMLGQ